jgi:hypothetical protein
VPTKARKDHVPKKAAPKTRSKIHSVSLGVKGRAQKKSAPKTKRRRPLLSPTVFDYYYHDGSRPEILFALKQFVSNYGKKSKAVNEPKALPNDLASLEEYLAILKREKHERERKSNPTRVTVLDGRSTYFITTRIAGKMLRPQNTKIQIDYSKQPFPNSKERLEDRFWFQGHKEESQLRILMQRGDFHSAQSEKPNPAPLKEFQKMLNESTRFDGGELLVALMSDIGTDRLQKILRECYRTDEKPNSDGKDKQKSNT